jgi:hypothetical protein
VLLPRCSAGSDFLKRQILVKKVIQQKSFYPTVSGHAEAVLVLKLERRGLFSRLLKSLV